MQSNQNLPQDFNTLLPYIQKTDTVDIGDTLYIKYLYDSLNVQHSEYLYDSLNVLHSAKDFKFELKEIMAPDTIDSLNQAVIYDKPSIFFPYKTQPVKILPKERFEVNYDWLTALFILCLVVMTWIRYEGAKRVTQLFRAVFARHNMNQLMRDGDVVHERVTPGLMFLYIISLSTLLMIFVEPYNIDIPGVDNPFLLFSFIAGVLMILWLFKLVVIKLSGKIFRTRNETDEYLVTNLIYNIASGLIAFPFVFAGHYADNSISITIALIIFAIGIVMRFVRSIFVGLSVQSFPVVYLFLYLCTLEILPFLIIYKLII